MFTGDNILVDIQAINYFQEKLSTSNNPFTPHHNHTSLCLNSCEVLADKFQHWLIYKTDLHFWNRFHDLSNIIDFYQNTTVIKSDLIGNNDD